MLPYGFPIDSFSNCRWHSQIPKPIWYFAPLMTSYWRSSSCGVYFGCIGLRGGTHFTGASSYRGLLSPASGIHLPPLPRLARWLLADTFGCKTYDVFYRELVRVKMRGCIFKHGNLLQFPRQLLSCVVHQSPMPCLFRAGMMTIHH